MRTEHADFHRRTAEIVKKMEDGTKKTAEAMLAGGAFADASLRTVNAIQKLRKSVSGV